MFLKTFNRKMEKYLIKNHLKPICNMFLKHLIGKEESHLKPNWNMFFF